MGRTFLLSLYNFGLEMKRMAANFGKTGFTQLKALVAEGAKLPSWSSRRASTEDKESQGARASVSTRLPTLPEAVTTSLQAAVDASEDMQLAIEELGLTDDLFGVLGVRILPVCAGLR